MQPAKHGVAWDPRVLRISPVGSRNCAERIVRKDLEESRRYCRIDCGDLSGSHDLLLQDATSAISRCEG